MSATFDHPFFKKYPAMAALEHTMCPSGDHVRACLMELARHILHDSEAKRPEAGLRLDDLITTDWIGGQVWDAVGTNSNNRLFVYLATTLNEPKNSFWCACVNGSPFIYGVRLKGRRHLMQLLAALGIDAVPPGEKKRA